MPSDSDEAIMMITGEEANCLFISQQITTENIFS